MTQKCSLGLRQFYMSPLGLDVGDGVKIKNVFQYDIAKHFGPL